MSSETRRKVAHFITSLRQNQYADDEMWDGVLNTEGATPERVETLARAVRLGAERGWSLGEAHEAHLLAMVKETPAAATQPLPPLSPSYAINVERYAAAGIRGANGPDRAVAERGVAADPQRVDDRYTQEINRNLPPGYFLNDADYARLCRLLGDYDAALEQQAGAFLGAAQERVPTNDEYVAYQRERAELRERRAYYLHAAIRVLATRQGGPARHPNPPGIPDPVRPDVMWSGTDRWQFVDGRWAAVPELVPPQPPRIPNAPDER